MEEILAELIFWVQLIIGIGYFETIMIGAFWRRDELWVAVRCEASQWPGR